MKLKFLNKRAPLIIVNVISIVLAFLLVVVLIVGNIILDINKSLLHARFEGDARGETEARSEAYALGDALVSQLVEDSAVLLRNEDDTLPLDADNDYKVNLFGWNATTNGFLLAGTGSGGSPVLNANRVDLATAFTEAGYEYNKELYDAYAAVSNDTINKVGQQSSAAMAAIHNPGKEFYTDERMLAARDYSDIAIVVFSRNTGENCGTNETINQNGYTDGAWLELTANEKLMLEKIGEFFYDGKVIVLMNTTNTMEMGFLENPDYCIDAALFIGAVGQSGARAIPHLLYGQKTQKDKDGNDVITLVSPSGRTADTYAYDYNISSDGKSYNASWTSTVSNNKSIYYQEGIYIGYKWYETADAEGFFDSVNNEYGDGYEGIVQFPFGYGLSYTEFKWTDVKWPSSIELTKDGKYEVKVTVENTGDVPGKDVVELYYDPPYTDGEIEKASTNLLAFAKTVTLEPGKSQEVILSFSAYDLASYDDYDKNDNGFKGYELDEGNHILKLQVDAHNDAKDRGLSANTRNMTCKGVQFETDPKTGTKVENLFTTTADTTAYQNQPLDGSAAFNGGINYLSRAGGFANFPTEKSYICRAVNNAPKQDLAYNGYADADVSDIQYGVPAEMYLVTKEGGAQATSDDLSGKTKNPLEYNTELMKKLWNYDADEWKDFLNQLSKAEIENLIKNGKFESKSVVSVGKPLCTELDGPAGFNQNSKAEAPSLPTWVVFPAEITLGCSWNPQSTYQMGKAMGVIGADPEASIKVHGWYGPGLNLHRSPYYGRNFEYYSEDAVLTGKLAAAVISGAKENNLLCYMKHFVCADTGPNSPNWMTWLTEQNLRENYLRAFEIAVKEGGANGVMSGFSALAGSWAGSNWALSTQILRNEWGFRGAMITDWVNDYMNVNRGIKAGNDLWLGNGSGSINFDNAADAYCARQSAKNILYSYVDCYMTAYDYAEKVASGEYDDPYAVNVSDVQTGKAAYSPLFAALWAIVDIILSAGILIGLALFVLTLILLIKLQKNKKVAATTTADGGAPVGDPFAEDLPVEEVKPENGTDEN